MSTDYLLGMTETKNHPNTEPDALYLSDDTLEVLKAGKLNHRLLSKHTKSPANQRGKAKPHQPHGKGKRKRE